MRYRLHWSCVDFVYAEPHKIRITKINNIPTGCEIERSYTDYDDYVTLMDELQNSLVHLGAIKVVPHNVNIFKDDAEKQAKYMTLSCIGVVLFSDLYPFL